MDPVTFKAKLAARMREERRAAVEHRTRGNTQKKWHHAGKADALSEILEILGNPPDPYRGHLDLWRV